jgi:hypothetical protein
MPIKTDKEFYYLTASSKPELRGVLIRSIQAEVFTPEETQQNLSKLDKAGRKVSKQEFSLLTGQAITRLWDSVETATGQIKLVPHQAPEEKPRSIREYYTQVSIPQQMLELFNEYGAVRRDFAKWWPTIGSEPFVGEVIGCPNLTGQMQATNGVEGFVTQGGCCFFCHFSNFTLFDQTLQGEMNRMVMPFNMWLKDQQQRRITTRDMESRKSNGWYKRGGKWFNVNIEGRKPAPRAFKPSHRQANEPSLNRAELLQLFA